MIENQGNKNVSSDFLRVLLATKEATLRDCNVADVAQIISIRNDGYHCCKSLSTLSEINALKLEDLEVSVNDVVLILYTNREFRVNLRKIKNSQPMINNSNSELHSNAYGIIIGKVYTGG